MWNPYQWYALRQLEEGEHLAVGTLDVALSDSEGLKERVREKAAGSLLIGAEHCFFGVYRHVCLAHLCHQAVWSSALVARLELVLCRLQAVAEVDPRLAGFDL